MVQGHKFMSDKDVTTLFCGVTNHCCLLEALQNELTGQTLGECRLRS